MVTGGERRPRQEVRKVTESPVRRDITSHGNSFTRHLGFSSGAKKPTGTVPQALTVALRLGGGQDGGYGNFHLPVFPTSLFFFLTRLYLFYSQQGEQ